MSHEEEHDALYHLGSLGAVVMFYGGAFLMAVATARTLADLVAWVH